jgi:hypothetical protein
VFINFLILFFLFNKVSCYVHEQDVETQIACEMEQMFQEFALLKNNDQQRDIPENFVHKIIFMWPIQASLIKQIIIHKTNLMTIVPKQNCYVISPYDGIVIEVDEINKTITTKHLVEGGIWYNITFKNIEKCKVKPDDKIKQGHIIGEVKKNLIFEIWQMGISDEPVAYMLFPAIDSNIIKRIKKI